MTQEEKWNLRFQEVKDFIETNHRNPSKCTGLKSIICCRGLNVSIR